MSGSRAAAHGPRRDADDLLTSIADLDREHAAGDVDDVDYQSLRRTYVARAALALRQAGTDDGRAPRVERRPSSRRLPRLRRLLGRRRVRNALGVIAAVCLAAVVALAAAHLAGVRLPGETATGSISLPSSAQVRQELEQASVLDRDGQLAEAISLYGTVLGQVPNQPEALAYRGWLVRRVGLAAHAANAVAAGDEELARAVAVAPNYVNAHILYGLALAASSRTLRPALNQFVDVLAEHPSRALLATFGRQMGDAYERAGQTVPVTLRSYLPRTGA